MIKWFIYEKKKCINNIQYSIGIEDDFFFTFRGCLFFFCIVLDFTYRMPKFKLKRNIYLWLQLSELCIHLFNPIIIFVRIYI